MRVFGEHLRETRKASGKTIAECANIFGVTQPAWTFWEQGTREPKLDTLVAIADFFGTTPDELLGLKEAKPPVQVVQRGSGNVSQIGNGNSAADCSNCASKQIADLMKQLGITVADIAAIAAKSGAAKVTRKK